LKRETARYIFYIKLRKLINEKGIPKERLAYEANLSQAQIYRLYRGVCSPNLETLDKLAKALGVTASSLIKSEGENETNE